MAPKKKEQKPQDEDDASMIQSKHETELAGVEEDEEHPEEKEPTKEE